MKKFIVFLLAIVFLLSMCIVGCGGKECSSHSYLNETIKQATCLENGQIKYICKNCDYEEIKVIEALGHKWEKDIVLKEATFYQEGVQKYKCSNCTAEKEQAISKLNKAFPKTPLTVTLDGDSIKFTLLEYKWSKNNSYIYYECVIINKINNFTSIPFVIYDEDGFIIESGNIYINGYYQYGTKVKGEKFIDVDINERFRVVIA